MPSLIVIAGPNGSGKSTLYKRLAMRIASFRKIPFVNPDDIAKELSGAYLKENTSQNRAFMLAAGKKALAMRKSLLAEGRSFGFETTLSGNSEIRVIEQAKNLGYSVTMVFVELDALELNIMRVKLRVQDGGHYVDPEDIIRRKSRSFENLKRVYPSLKRLYLVDNSGKGYHTIASIVQAGTTSMKVRTSNVKDRWFEALIEHFKTIHKKSQAERRKNLQ